MKGINKFDERKRKVFLDIKEGKVIRGDMKKKLRKYIYGEYRGKVKSLIEKK